MGDTGLAQNKGIRSESRKLEIKEELKSQVLTRFSIKSKKANKNSDKNKNWGKSGTTCAMSANFRQLMTYSSNAI